MKIRPVAAELLHVDSRTDRHDESNSRFSQFCERAYKPVHHNIGVFVTSIWGLLQHVSVKRDHLQLVHISKITKQIHWVMGFYV
jgi:hypothetical protein